MERELADLSAGDRFEEEDSSAALDNVLDVAEEDGDETDEAREEADEDFLNSIEAEEADPEALAPVPTPQEIRAGKIALEKVS